MNEDSTLAKITIHVPPGCTKTALSFDALDSLRRELARQTFIYADGKQLLCRSFTVRTKPDGEKVVLLEVMQDCFEITETAPPTDE